jgi:hypothetical protein
MIGPRPRTTVRVVLAAATVLALGGCSDSAADPDASAASAGASGPSTPTAPAEPAPEPILLGEQRYLSPCRLVDIEDVEKVFGKLGDQGYLTQTVLTDSLVGKELERALSFGRIDTSCSYSFGDDDLTSVRVTVGQYPSPAEARAEWAEIRRYGSGKESAALAAEGAPAYLIDLARETEAESGGDPVARAPELLFVAGKRDFVFVVGHALVRVAYSSNIDTFRTDRFTQQEYADQVPLMVGLRKRVVQRFERGIEDQSPASSVLGEETLLGGVTPFLEPCDLLTAEVFEAATGQSPDPETEVESYQVDSEKRYRTYREERPLVASTDARCSRRAAVGEKATKAGGGGVTSYSVELTVQPTDSDVQSFEVLEHTLGNRYFEGPAEDSFRISQFLGLGYMRELDGTGADRAFVLDSKLIQEAAGLDRFKDGWFTVGPYVVHLDADRGGSLGRPTRVLSDRQYAEAIDLVAQEIRSRASAEEPGT